MRFVRRISVVTALVLLALVVSACGSRPDVKVDLRVGSSGSIEQKVELGRLELDDDQVAALKDAGWRLSGSGDSVILSRKFDNVDEFEKRAGVVGDTLAEAIAAQAGAEAPGSVRQRLRIKRVNYLFAEKMTVEYSLPPFDVEPQFCVECGGDSGADCEDCDGEGTVQCGTCGGKGTLTCEECNGKGTQTCEECNGTKQVRDSWTGELVDCSWCDGTGLQDCDNWDCENGQVECDECYGDRVVECDTCGGNGWIDCDFCEDGEPSQQQLDDYSSAMDAGRVRVALALPGVGARGGDASGDPDWRFGMRRAAKGITVDGTTWVVNWLYTGIAAAVLAALLTLIIALLVRKVRRVVRARKSAVPAPLSAVPAAAPMTQPESAIPVPGQLIAGEDVTGTFADEKRFCGSCGSPVNPGAGFCPSCGAKL